METTRPPGFPGNPPARMPRAPTPARSPPPRPLRCGEIAFRPTHDVGPHKQCISGLNHAAYGLPVNASRPGSPQAHASLGSGWQPTLAGWDWIPTGCRTRFQRSHHGILSPLTGLSRHTRWCTNRDWPARCQPTRSSPADAIRHGSAEGGHPIEDFTAEDDLTPLPSWAPGAKALSVCDTRARAPSGTRRRVSYPVSDSMSVPHTNVCTIQRPAGQPRRGKRLRMCSCPRISGEVVYRSVDGRLHGPRFWWGPARRQPVPPQGAEALAFTGQRTMNTRGTRPGLSPTFYRWAEPSLTVQPLGTGRPS